MIEQVIPWSTGGGNVVVSYEGKGKGELLITSPDNPLWEDRSMTIIVETTAGSPEKAETIVLTQKGKTLAVGTEFNFDYTVIRSKRKSYSLEVTRDGAVKVRVPQRARDGDVISFIEKHNDWVLKKLS